MRLHLIRHPPPEISAGICYGQSDVPVRQLDCNLAAERLRLCLPVGAPVFSSPLQRCWQLAQLLHAAPHSDARLMEMNFGRWELQSWEQIARHEVDAWAADISHYAPGGGESVLQMATRMIAFAEQIIHQHSTDVVIVCHAGSIRLLTQWQPGMSAATLAERVSKHQHRIDFSSCTRHELLM